MTGAQSLARWAPTRGERERAVVAMRQCARELRARSAATERDLDAERRTGGGRATRQVGLFAQARALAYAADEIDALADSL
mgnify:CR=1 FL=1